VLAGSGGLGALALRLGRGTAPGWGNRLAGGPADRL